jgi:hypothetical protein
MRIIVLLSILAVSPGCTNLALKRATLAHAESSTDLRYKEVMDNLALVASNPDFIPSYTSIYYGTTDVNDIGKATSTNLWARTAVKPFRYNTFFSQDTADFMGSRAVKMNWSLDPTIVPEKLRAIRAACRWVTFGPDSAGADVRYLMGGDAADPCHASYYFDVIHRLETLPLGWLHVSDHRLDVPLNASYWASCGGKFVWVSDSDMGFLSEFTLILQQIARADLEQVSFPKPQTRKIQKVFPIDRPAPTGGVTRYQAEATFYVDEAGLLTPGDNAPALPRKKRFDNYGQISELRSVINASSKSGP